MNTFDPRWQQAAARARQAPDPADDAPPHGFATRVLARWREAQAESWEDLFSALGLRALLGATALLLVSAGYMWVEWYETRMPAPSLGEAVTSQLPWP